MREAIETANAPKAIGPYSQAVRAGGMIFCSGQIPLDPATNTLLSGSVQQETERVLENLQAVLRAAGASVEDVVKTTVFLTNMDDFAAMNEVYARYFSGPVKPARATVAVAGLPRGVRVEIDAVALEKGR